MPKIYGGIGSRKLSNNERRLCFDTAHWLARQGWELYTGAAIGADQAFAEGALAGGGNVTLVLPWPSYEFKWVEPLGHKPQKRILRYDDWDARNSVDQYHPNPENLKDGTRKLHARNYLIVQPTQFVLAFPKPGYNGGLGGTGQGIRIAAGLGTTTLRLDEPFDRKRVEDQVYTLR